VPWRKGVLEGFVTSARLSRLTPNGLGVVCIGIGAVTRTFYFLKYLQFIALHLISFRHAPPFESWSGTMSTDGGPVPRRMSRQPGAGTIRHRTIGNQPKNRDYTASRVPPFRPGIGHVNRATADILTCDRMAMLHPSVGAKMMARGVTVRQDQEQNQRGD
jgi:hypothetical protein